MPVVGVIGGGQLARMMHPAALALGIELRVFAEQEDSPAKSAVTMVGDYLDFDRLKEFCAGLDALTFDHEHVPTQLLEKIEELGISVRPGSTALIHAQNKLVMRERLTELGLPMPHWSRVASPQDLEAFLLQHGPKIIVKTPIGGYDGKGVRVVESLEQVADWLENISQFGGYLLAEEKVEFIAEVAQLCARNPSGEFRAWPLVQTIQEDSVCSVVISPAPSEFDADAALDIARRISAGLGVVGVLAVELFVAKDGRLLINELAMRPHNSGHFSIEGSITSQFEQHLRAVLDLPLGDTAAVAPVAVMVNLLGVNQSNNFVQHYPKVMNQFPKVKFHSYQKEPRLGRKMGHLTILGNDAGELQKTGLLARQALYRAE
jgi:5-(carboxyamino)imidazole ribonucleotide synthase